MHLEWCTEGWDPARAPCGSESAHSQHPCYPGQWVRKVFNKQTAPLANSPSWAGLLWSHCAQGREEEQASSQQAVEILGAETEHLPLAEVGRESRAGQVPKGPARMPPRWADWQCIDLAVARCPLLLRKFGRGRFYITLLLKESRGQPHPGPTVALETFPTAAHRVPPPPPHSASSILQASA